jgi:hypothetical protein
MLLLSVLVGAAIGLVIGLRRPASQRNYLFDVGGGAVIGAFVGMVVWTLIALLID